MIGYVTIGTNNFEKSKTFYDGVLAELGGKRTMTGERMQGYGTKGGAERQKALADWIAAGNDPKDFPQGKSVGGGPPQATPTPAR